MVTQIPPNAKWFSVLGLKDASFSIPLHLDSQKFFAFEWTDPITNHTQLCWSVLVQGFSESPTMFSYALGRDLEEWKQ